MGQDITAGQNREESKRRARDVGLEKLLHEPYVARLAFKKTKKIARRYGKLTAAYFLVYSWGGGDRLLLLWFSSIARGKPGSATTSTPNYSTHYYFQLLGLREGIMYKHIQENIEAIEVALEPIFELQIYAMIFIMFSTKSVKGILTCLRLASANKQLHSAKYLNS